MHAQVASTQELAHALQAVWKHIGRTASGEFFRTVDELELSLTQLKALHLLDDHSELSVKQLGEALHLSLPAASRAADGLVQRGLLERRECAEDRRSRRMRLSEAGAEALRQVTEARLAGLAEFVETLEESERAALAAALAPIVERMGR